MKHRFRIIEPSTEKFVILLNDISYLLIIEYCGLKRADTGFFQVDVDYDKSNGRHCPRIIGVDEI